MVPGEELRNLWSGFEVTFPKRRLRWRGLLPISGPSSRFSHKWSGVMDAMSYSRLASAIFAVVALLQLVRAVAGWPVAVGGTAIPV